MYGLIDFGLVIQSCDRNITTSVVVYVSVCRYHMYFPVVILSASTSFGIHRGKCVEHFCSYVKQLPTVVLLQYSHYRDVDPYLIKISVQVEDH